MGARYIVSAVKKNDLETLKKELYFFKNYIRKDYDLDQVIYCKNEQRLLHIAVKYGSKEVFSYLLEQNIDINIADIKGNTAAHYAVLYRHPEILKLLKEKGADFFRKNNDGYTLEQYIQVKLKKKCYISVKKELETIIWDTIPFGIISGNAQVYFREETTEKNYRQSEQEALDTSALSLLAEVAIQKDGNSLNVKNIEQKEVCFSKIQVSHLSFFHDLSQEIECQTQTEPLNLVKHDRPLNLSITSCFKNKA